MQEGFYWVQRGAEQPEVWFFSTSGEGAWFEPTKNDAISKQRFAEQGYRTISEKLSLP
ncbi:MULTISPECIES: hypothetical protein [Pantoea]|jgi:hypothetical protein|uniref:hypothetical protein n=1 Tax=Pantoea TaxID=53335 RepID=UPI000A9A0C05|nr:MULTISPECIES: hypothetical protein [Pantoea]KAF0857485.1 hypothetical protein Y788_00120 [Pantoea dispersa 625]MBS0899750.1 hypothetical protein [Pantoea dispersa]MBS0905823.1 hypothetical protein [Pantoea dispersa]MBU6517773.1 hypothetical protein [Pantoea sp. B270]MCI1030249.1 hypothetical protein [Pantoea dispersa]